MYDMFPTTVVRVFADVDVLREEDGANGWDVVVNVAIDTVSTFSSSSSSSSSGLAAGWHDNVCQPCQHCGATAAAAAPRRPPRQQPTS